MKDYQVVTHPKGFPFGLRGYQGRDFVVKALSYKEAMMKARRQKRKDETVGMVLLLRKR